MLCLHFVRKRTKERATLLKIYKRPWRGFSFHAARRHGRTSSNRIDRGRAKVSTVARLAPSPTSGAEGSDATKSSDPSSGVGRKIFLSSEVDNLFASAESRIETQRNYVRSVSCDFEASMKAITELDTTTSALDTLKAYRARITEGGKEC
jgi:hypothetical protein